MHGISEEKMQEYADYYASNHPVFITEHYAKPGKLVGSVDLIRFTNDKSSWYKSEFYNDFLTGLELDHSIGITTQQTSSVALNFTLVRPTSAGYYGAEEEFRFLKIVDHVNKVLALHRKIDALELRASISKRALTEVNGRLESAVSSTANTLLQKRINDFGLTRQSSTVKLPNTTHGCFSLTITPNRDTKSLNNQDADQNDLPENECE